MIIICDETIVKIKAIINARRLDEIMGRQKSSLKHVTLPLGVEEAVLGINQALCFC